MMRRTRKRKERRATTTNSFEVRVNKRKHTVLGRTLKSERGIRGQARSKAVQKRKRTLLLEYQRRNKTGLFVDKRLGEYDKWMSVEEKMLQRFTMERQRQHERRHVDFSLEEEPDDLEVSLSKKGIVSNPVEIDDFRLTEEDVKQAHFGGFHDDYGSQVLHRPQVKIMEDVITRSKKAKFERQNARDSLADLTDRLDSEWASIRTVMSHGDVQLHADHVIDDYDLTVKQLSLESRAQPSQRMKTENETQSGRKGEKKLQKIGMTERLQTSRKGRQFYMSADALDEELDIEELPGLDGASADIGAQGVMHQVVEDSEGNEEDTENDGTDHEDSDNENEKDNKDNKEKSGEIEAKSEESWVDSQSDKNSCELSEYEGEEMLDRKAEKKNVSKEEHHDYSGITEQSSKLFVPCKLEQLTDMLSGKNSEAKVRAVEVMLERLLVKQSMESKRNLEVLFTVLVEYIEYLCSEPSADIHLADQFTQSVLDACCTVPHVAANCIKGVLIKQSQFTRQQRLDFRMSQLFMLRLCGVLLPTADHQQGLSTATITLLTKCLSQCKVISSCEAFRGLFLLSVVHELVYESTKYVPEVPLFLSGVLSLVCKSLFSSLSGEMEQGQVGMWKAVPISLSKLLPEKLEESSLSWLSVLYVALRLLSKFASLYERLTSYPSMFCLVIEHLVSLSSFSLPVAIQERLTLVTMQLKTSHVALNSLQFQHQKPIPLRLYTPQFKESFLDNKTSHRNSSAQLRVKHRKELRGAIRELRQDAAFLSRQKLKDQLASDLERKRRVMALQQMLSTEGAEMKQHRRKLHSDKAINMVSARKGRGQ